MYDERKERFSFRDVIIQVLFIAIFIFLLLWLFPMKSDLKGALTEPLAPLYDQIFNQNATTMKEAAITYYTTPRLPKKVGDEEKMTLSKMLSENLILPFVDSKGNQCDLNESYVSITKMNEEYIMKVNLKCSNQEDYILVHLGCYNYCEGQICEKKEEKVEPTPVPTPTPTPTPVVNPDKYEYEYVLVTDGKWGEYSGWSEWTQNVITKTNYRDVETKTEKVTTTKTEQVVTYEPVYEEKKVQTGTKKEAYTEDVQVTKYKDVDVYEDKKVQVGVKDIYGNITKYEKVPVYGTETVYENRTVTTKVPVYGTEAVYENRTVTNKVPVYGTEDVYETRTTTVKVPVYGTEDVYETKTTTVKVPVYGTEDVYENRKVTKYKTEKVFVKMEYSLDCTNGCKRVEKPVYETKQVPYTVTEKVKTGTKKVITGYTTKTTTEKVKTGTKKVITGYKNETKTEKVKVGTKKVITGYKNETSTVKVQVGTKQVITGYENKVTTEKVAVGTRQVITGYTTKAVDTKEKIGTEPVYEIQKVKVGTKRQAYTVTEKVTKYKEVPVYTVKKVQTGTKKVVKEVQTPVTTTVTYYRSRTREYLSGKIDTKWSQSQNDQSLLKLGYSLTGNSRKI